jgi:hypothetical protein
MSKTVHPLIRAYFSVPYVLLAVVLVLAGFAATNLKHFAYDASADTLVAENDEALAYFQRVSENFGGDNFLFLTYEPKGVSLISPESLAQIATLQEQLEAIAGVAGVTSVLDVPLLRSPPVNIQQLATDYKILRMEDVDLELAKQELRESPLYRELLISSDGRATALRINLEGDNKLSALWQERKRLRAILEKTPEQADQLRAVEEGYSAARRDFVADQERLMRDIRDVRDSVAGNATAYLAGVPMIASDMIRYVRNDITTFGGICLIVVMLILFAFFRQPRWVILPVLTALLAVLITAGILGFLRQPVTVISANFVALLIIFSISFTVHLMVRYRELVRGIEGPAPKEVLIQAMADKFAPCIYTALTTMAAFASLTASDIIPVDDLGWIMCLAMAVAFIVNYTFFPAMVLMLPGRHVAPLPDQQPLLTRIMRWLSTRLSIPVFLAALVAVGASVFGMMQLSTESRFIDYFREQSEIKQGLVFIDKNLGGTTPMDVILNFDPYEPYEDTSFGEEDDFFTETEDEFPARYWYTPDKIQKLRQMHAYLETKPEVGKIVSLATLEEIARGFNNGEALGTVQLAAIVGALPADLRREFLGPYSVPEEGILRISMRMRETAPRSSRDALIEDIQAHAINEVGFAPEDVNVTGMNVLFNNMLKVLFQSQQSTIGLVVLATFIMLLVLLRSPLLAVIGVIPNLLSAVMVLGFMGYMNITLDMMTMTIAAIIIGIGVDNAIHYLHRFRDEIARGLDRMEAIEASHNSIGFALYFTSATVIVGFSVLALSNFIPTVYFGVLTAMAMALSLLVNLVVLPSLLMIFYRTKKATPASA